MTEQVPVTLDDLKRAIEAYESGRSPQIPDKRDWHYQANRRAEAWRTAFEWLECGGGRMPGYRQDQEREEGVRLIREKLR